MNTATQNLENDHIYILRLIDVMEKIVMNCSTDLSHMEMVVRLIQQFADSFHHAKEENLFFPLMVQKGFSNENGPVSVMLHDHDQGRKFTDGMEKAIAKYKQGGDDLVLPEIYLNMQGYIDLLRAHIGKENNVLFKMADRLLSPMEQERLLKAFTEVETNDYGNGKMAQFLVDIEGLEAIYMAD
jgi:hemerythrin-like domain-containing protein